MKRLFLVLAVSFSALYASAQFSGSGTGTESDPYLIFNQDQLSQLGNFLNQSGVYFKLMTDMDLAQWIADNNPTEGWTPIGVEASPFKGVFDGNSHSISGFTINRSEMEFVGFFGYIDGATIKNVTINGNVTGRRRVGGICGYAKNSTFSSIICNVAVTGADRIGVLCGAINGVTITGCTAKGNISGAQEVGGVSGIAENGTNKFSNTNYEGNISATRMNAGGIIAYLGNGSSTSFSSCYSNSNITNQGDNTGGIVAYCYNGNISSMTNCCHFGDINGANYVGGIIGINNATKESVPKYQKYMTKFETRETMLYSPGIEETIVQQEIMNNVAIGSIKGGDFIGGIIGKDMSNVSYSYNGCSTSYYGSYSDNYEPLGCSSNYPTKVYRNNVLVYTANNDTRYRFEEILKEVSFSFTDSYYAGNITGKNNVGGIAGYKECGTISKCYANIGSIIAETNVGGIVGSMQGISASRIVSIKSNVLICSNIAATSQTFGRIYGKKNNDYTAIGAAGSADGNKAFSQTVVLLNGVKQSITDNLQNGNSIGLSALKLKANYVALGWNFDSDWNIQETECFPYKKYQAAPPVIESELVSQSTSISGKSINNGDVYLYYKDNNRVSTAASGNNWTFSTEPLQAGATVKMFAIASGLKPSYFVTATVKYPGSGTSEDPYRVYTADDLQNMSGAYYYKLMNDVDISTWISKNSPTAGWRPIGKDTGGISSFDGNGHTISGLWTNTTENYTGLFSNFSSGIIKNLTVRIASGKQVKGGNHTGGLIGRNANGSITNCSVYGNVSGTVNVGGVVGTANGSAQTDVYFEGKVTSSTADACIGGIAGLTSTPNGTNFENCISVATITSTGSGSPCVGGLIGKATAGTLKQCIANAAIKVSGCTTGNVGGLVGKNGDNTSQCFSSGTVEASGSETNAGGLMGYTSAWVNNCYSTANVSGSLYSAGLVGYVYNTTIDGCYATGNVSGKMYGAGVVGELDNANAALTNSVAMNNKIELTDQSSWGCRVIGGYKNGAQDPDDSNFALSAMQVTLNGLSQTKTDNIVEGIAKTQSELQTSAFYSALGWDFETIWAIDEGNGYPYLAFMTESEDTIFVSSITLNCESDTLEIDETIDITATVLPADAANKTITWSSSDEAVATVEDGTVTAVAAGTATITAKTSDGTNLTATCVITVAKPDDDEPGDDDNPGTPEPELLPTTDVTAMDYALYFPDMEVNTDVEVAIPLNLKNAEENITAFQCDIYLPEGVKWASSIDKRGNEILTQPAFNADADRTDANYHTITPVTKMSNGAYRVMCYSMNKEIFLDNDGAVLDIPVVIPEDMEDGDYNLIIKDIFITDTDTEQHEVEEVVSKLTVVGYTLGDPNADGLINITDIVSVISYILEEAPANFNFKAADVNGDGIINITDIVAIIDIILSDEAPASARRIRRPAFGSAPAGLTSLEIVPFGIDAGTTSATVTLDLLNPNDEFTAFECDIVLPEGIDWEYTIDRRGNIIYTQPTFNADADRTDANYHTLSNIKKMEDGSFKVMCYSMAKEIFLDEAGAILNLPLTFSPELAEGIYEIEVANTVLTRTDVTDKKIGSYRASVVVGTPDAKTAVIYGDVNATAVAMINERLAGCGTLDLRSALAVDGNTAFTLNDNAVIFVADGMSIKNEKNVIEDGTCAVLTLTDGVAFTPSESFTAESASYGRTLGKDEYGTLVLPFEPNVATKAAYAFYELSEADGSTLTFDETTTPEAGTPYVIVSKDAATTFAGSGTVAITAGDAAADGWTMKGTYETLVFTDATDLASLYCLSGNQFKQATSKLTMNPFRAYFQGSGSVGSITLRGSDGTTRILNETLQPAGDCYDLTGRRVLNAERGIYIVNGKKVLK